MRQNAINEFKLWTVFLATGVAILATELVVKATRPSIPVPELEGRITDFLADAYFSTPDDSNPEELVANLLVESVVMIESGGNAKTVGSKGERGLMQIMEATWRETTRSHFGREITFKRAFEPELNRQVGTAYLAHLHQYVQAHRDQWQSNERSLLLACYNAGPQRVAKAGFNLRNLPASTQDYVKRASALHDSYLEKHEIKLAPGNGRGVMQIVSVPGISGT